MGLSKLLEDAMRFEAKNGRCATIKISREHFNEISDSERYVVEGQGYIQGIPFYIEANLKQGYVIH